MSFTLETTGVTGAADVAKRIDAINKMTANLSAGPTAPPHTAFAQALGAVTDTMPTVAASAVTPSLGTAAATTPTPRRSTRPLPSTGSTPRCCAGSSSRSPASTRARPARPARWASPS